MTVERGKFRIYPSATPSLRPGRYNLRAAQVVERSGEGALLTAKADEWSLQVVAPRLTMPPEEILGSFPAPGTLEGNMQQLPHVVLKSRVMPWARQLAGLGADSPWLAVLLFRKDEAKLVTNGTLGQYAAAVGSTADALFPGISKEIRSDLAGEPMQWVEAKRSVLRAIVPGRDTELKYLAHVREVNTQEDEGRGDDDGFVSFVICNRLPNVRDAEWLACLVNLEPFKADHAIWQRGAPARDVNAALAGLGAVVEAGPLFARLASSGVLDVARVAAEGGTIDLPSDVIRADARGPRTGPAAGGAAFANLRVVDRNLAVRATDLIDVERFKLFLDPTFRVPVLHQWVFKTAPEVTDFETLIQAIGRRRATAEVRAGLGLLGDDVRDLQGGHLAVQHRTRGGVDGRSYYRGPLVSTAMLLAPDRTAPPPGFPADPAALIVADQLVSIMAGGVGITPDDKPENVSYAVAYETGRLIALSRKDVLQLLVDWQRLAKQQRLGHSIRHLLAPFNVRGLREPLDLVRTFARVRERVVNPALDPVRLDYTGLRSLAAAANGPHVAGAPADLWITESGLSSRVVTQRTALPNSSAVAAGVGGREPGQLPGIAPGELPGAGLPGRLTPGGVPASLAGLDALFPELLEVVRLDFTRGGT